MRMISCKNPNFLLDSEDIVVEERRGTRLHLVPRTEDSYDDIKMRQLMIVCRWTPQAKVNVA